MENLYLNIIQLGQKSKDQLWLYVKSAQNLEQSRKHRQNLNSGEIRKARESKKWSREDLGKKINERVSVITRIETGKMTPDTKLTKKLEKALNINLLEEINNVDLNQFISGSSGERTLGNVMRIKRK